MSEKNGSILILDDSEDLLQLMTILIERRCDRKAIAVTSLSEIEARLDEALSCDLAVLDINLGPNKPNGVDAYRWLRANSFDKPIYFLTGHAQTFPLVVEAEKLGNIKVLSKPIDTNLFMTIIREHA